MTPTDIRDTAIPEDVMEAARKHLEATPKLPPYKHNLKNVIARAIMAATEAATEAERERCAGFLDNFIKDVEIEISAKKRFDIYDINRQAKKAMRYVRDQITGDFEKNWSDTPTKGAQDDR